MDDELPDSGKGLFLAHSLPQGTILGIYENGPRAKRITKSRVKHPDHISDYAVEYGTLVRDAWNPNTGTPCCLVPYSNDPLDKTKDNATFYIHPAHPTKLLLVLTKSTEADRPAYTPYGGHFWCDAKYPVRLHIQAIIRYEIDIHSSTEATQGNWLALPTAPELLLRFPAPIPIPRPIATPPPNCSPELLHDHLRHQARAQDAPAPSSPKRKGKLAGKLARPRKRPAPPDPATPNITTFFASSKRPCPAPADPLPQATASAEESAAGVVSLALPDVPVLSVCPMSALLAPDNRLTISSLSDPFTVMIRSDQPPPVEPPTPASTASLNTLVETVNSHALHPNAMAMTGYAEPTVDS